MSKQSLATVYRPQTFSDLVEQSSIKTILTHQIENNECANTYLFVGPAGTGKTTVARIFATMLNNGIKNYIEIDAASNNGVDDIRKIIDESKYQDLTSPYKVYIIDECHMLTVGAWNAFLKLLEEPPSKTIFILCTTDTRKILPTVISRCQRYDFKNISVEGIVNRLKYIIAQEGGISYTEDAIDYIARLANGCMRNSITLLDKCISFSKEVTLDNVLEALNSNDNENMYLLLSAIFNNNLEQALTISEYLYQLGTDIKLFVKQFIDFEVNIIKYIATKDITLTNLNPKFVEEFNDMSTEDSSTLSRHKSILNLLIKINSDIKYEQNPIILLQANLINFIEGEEK